MKWSRRQPRSPAPLWRNHTQPHRGSRMPACWMVRIAGNPGMRLPQGRWGRRTANDASGIVGAIVLDRQSVVYDSIVGTSGTVGLSDRHLARHPQCLGRGRSTSPCRVSRPKHVALGDLQPTATVTLGKATDLSCRKGSTPSGDGVLAVGFEDVVEGHGVVPNRDAWHTIAMCEGQADRRACMRSVLSHPARLRKPAAFFVWAVDPGPIQR